MKRLTDGELKTMQANRAEGKASFACEGIVLTAEEDSLFEQFDAERLAPDERRARLRDFCRRKQAAKVDAAE